MSKTADDLAELRRELEAAELRAVVLRAENQLLSDTVQVLIACIRSGREGINAVADLIRRDADQLEAELRRRYPNIEN